MYVPWLNQLQRYWFGRRSSKTQNTARRSSINRRVRLRLEPLEERWAPAADTVQTVANNLSTPFSEAQQTLTLSANVSDTTNPSTTVSEGTVTFTVKDSHGTTVGSAVQGTVSGGKANASFALPANEASGPYTIDVTYSDSAGTFTDGGDTSGTLTVNPASVKVAGNNASATFSKSSQTITVSANVSDTSFPSDTVGEGTVTFTLKNSSGLVLGSSAQGAVSGGKASASLSLPAGMQPGSYTIAVAYSDSSGSGNFSDGGSDTNGTLAVSAASTTTQASNATADFSSSAQNVTLKATVTSSSGIVNEGSVTFNVVDSNGKTIGTAQTSAVTNGSASVSYALPAGTSAGSYTIEATYFDSAGNFGASFDNSHTLTVNASNATSLSLTSASITPSLANGSAQVKITVQVSNPNGTVNEGVLSVTVAGVSGQANVSNGSATVTLTVPFQGLSNGMNVDLSFTDSATNPNFADATNPVSVSTTVFNTLLPANLTFDSSGNETMQFTVGNQPLFGASYSAALNGMLSTINIGSTSVPMTYTTVGTLQFASAGGTAWGLIIHDSEGNIQFIANVQTASDGSLIWVFRDTKGQVVDEKPYGELFNFS